MKIMAENPGERRPGRKTGVQRRGNTEQQATESLRKGEKVGNCKLRRSRKAGNSKLLERNYEAVAKSKLMRKRKSRQP